MTGINLVSSVLMIFRKNQSHHSQQLSYPMTARANESISSSVEKQPARFLLIAVWFALLTGLAEASWLGVEKFFLHREILLSRHVAWMAPLADILIFAIPGLFLFLVAWCWPRLVSLRIAAFVFAFLGFLSLLLMATWFSNYARLLLAVGLAFQTARFIAARPRGFHSLVGHTAVWMVAIVVGLAVIAYGWQALGERRAVAKLPPAPSSGAPNVLLIVLDTVRAQSLSLYGYARSTTPQLERLAKTGVVFERAVATGSWTVPSHTSMFHGRYLHELPENWFTVKQADSRHPSLAEALSERGYMTAGFVANLTACSYESGLDRGFAHYEDYPVSLGQIILSSSLGRNVISKRLRRFFFLGKRLNHKLAADLNGDFLHWLSRNEERPFFAFLNYFDAHAPYLPPEPFDRKFASRAQRANLSDLAKQGAVPAGKNVSPQTIQEMLDAYEGSIAYLDHQLGLLFDELEARGVLKNTLVIITSDHGEEFADHGFFGHSYNLYSLVLHVPLLVSFPARMPTGERIREPVTLRDIPATVIDLLNIEDEARFSGNSLARHWDGTRDPHSPVDDSPLSELSGHGRAPTEWATKSLVIDQYHYIRNGDGREELYNLENDPFEKHNLADSEEGRRACERFRTSLETSLMRNQQSELMIPDGGNLR